MSRLRAAALAAGFGLLASAPLSHAGYGLNPPATAVQSGGLANAVFAVADDTDALNSNPAGLSRIEGSRVDTLLEPFYWLVHHDDDIGGRRAPDDLYGAIVAGGYAQRLDPQWVAALGLTVQGGSGFNYGSLPNAVGAPGPVSALFGSVRIAPGLAWQATPQLAFGLSVGLVYSSARQKLLPENSVPAGNGFPGFNGFRLDGLEGFSGNARFGLLYEPSPRWTLAAGYATKTPIRLKNGRMKLNRDASGEAPLTYEDVELRGLNFAPDVTIGAAFRPDQRWTISGNISWLDWSNAMATSHLRASKPNDPSAAPILALDAPLNFRDNVVFALGASYQWTPATQLRAGAAYARNPQGKEGVTPALNLVADRTVSAGFAHRFGAGWEFGGSALLQPPNSMRYDNPLFGGEAKESFGALAFYLGLSRRW